MQHHLSRFTLSLVRALSHSALSPPLRVRELSPSTSPPGGGVCVRACPRGCSFSLEDGRERRFRVYGAKSGHTSRRTLTCSQTCQPNPWASHPFALPIPSTMLLPSLSVAARLTVSMVFPLCSVQTFICELLIWFTTGKIGTCREFWRCTGGRHHLISLQARGRLS